MLEIARYFCYLLGWEFRGPVRCGEKEAFLVHTGAEFDVYTLAGLLATARGVVG
jgi:hypothetical protein